MRGAILICFAAAVPAIAEAAWTVLDADPIAVARVEAPQAKGADQPAFLEIACMRGTSAGAYMLRAEMRAPRSASDLPAETMREVRRLGRDCPGPIATSAGSAKPGPIVLRVGAETISTNAALRDTFLRSEAPIETRPEPPCEIATHAVDPDEARLEVEGAGETRTRYLAELLMAEHLGEVTVEAPRYGVRQSFQVEGAAAALSAIGRICGWEDSSPRW